MKNEELRIKNEETKFGGRRESQLTNSIRGYQAARPLLTVY